MGAWRGSRRHVQSAEWRRIRRYRGGLAELAVERRSESCADVPGRRLWFVRQPQMGCTDEELQMKTAPLFTLVSAALLAQGRPIPFGSALDADQQILESQQLAKEILSAPDQQRRAKGDQHRTYDFRAAKKTVPYRLYVPTTWDGQSKLSLIVMLHGAGS